MIELTPAVILISKAKHFAIEAHGNQKYGDYPYSHHLEQVVANVKMRNQGSDMLTTLIAVAWLHDTMEDCGVSHKQLLDEFGLCIADSVQYLTKTEELSYEDYMVGCCESSVAREVKICDTLANLNESFRTNRVKGMNKYPKQLAILTDGIWCGELLFNKGDE